MAVVSMMQIRIIALTEYRKPLMELLQRRGVVQLQNDLPHDDVFERLDITAPCAQFQRGAQAAEQALEILSRYAPQKAGPLDSLKGRAPLAPGQLEQCAARRDELSAQAAEILQLEKQLCEAKAAIPKLQVQIGALSPWMGLEVPFNFAGTASTRAFIGSFSGDHTADALLQSIQLPADVPLDLTILSHSKEQTCVFVLCPKKNAAAVENALRHAGFSLPALAGSLNPQQQKAAWEEEIRRCEALIQKNTRLLAGFGPRRADLELLADYYSVRREKYLAMGKLAQTRHVFVAEGYAPAPDAAALQNELREKFFAAVELIRPDPKGEQPPVELRNGGFSAPMEGVLASYSFPGRGEFDPSFMMALFYYFLFGMMLSDAGYGLLIVLVCGVLLAKFKNMDKGLKKSLTMFFFSGISTVFWGILYGSWFGDAPDVIAHTFLHSDFTLKPLWVNPINCPMQMLMFCLLIGLIHLFAGLACKAYLLIRQKDGMALLADVVSWYLLVGGLILFALASPAFIKVVQLGFVLPAAVGAAGKWLAIAGALLVLLFAGREAKNPLMRLVKGLYALYGSTSWLGDLLSYSRLLALGLATGVIGQVVNQMASMGGDTPLGIVLFIVVFLVGHALNIAINLLGAYVHTNRLQFVEFFGKFYEGGGQPFEPLAAHTKYYQISEVK